MALFLSPAAGAVVQLEKQAEGFLDSSGAQGFRLIRAEADGRGVMWLIMERVSDGDE